MKRPTTDNAHGSHVTTPMAAAMIALLGPGFTQSSVAMSRDEYRALMRLYGYEPEKPRAKPPLALPRREDFKTAYLYDDAVKAAKDAHAKWEDPRRLMQAGADRALMRHAEVDGLRLVAWLAKFVTPGDDPLKHLVQLAIDGGWDVDPSDVSWVEGEDSEEEDAA